MADSSQVTSSRVNLGFFLKLRCVVLSLVIHFNWTLTFKWCVVRLDLRNVL